MTRDVLIIDDSPTVRKLVEISLRGAPLTPHFAELGADGIRRAAALEPAAIVLDFVLPDMTAVDVCRALDANPRTRRIPVLVVTAKDERSRAELAPFRAVVDFVAKPFVGPDLLARVERAIAGTRRASADPIERAAKLLFTRLRDGLEQLPAQLAQLAQLGPGAVAPQLARHLLTPEVVARIVADLRALDDAGPAPRAPRDGEGPGGDAVLDRAPGFSAKLQGAQLATLDRRILAVVDGRLSLAAIADHLALDGRQVAAACRALIARGLVVELPRAGRARPVIICEPDAAAFREPLRALLQQRPTPRELIAVESLDDVVATALRRHACLVMVNASARVPAACAVAQALRADRTLTDLAMVAVLEPRAAPSGDLVAAGFDTVLGKPLRVAELERFLTPTDLR